MLQLIPRGCSREPIWFPTLKFPSVSTSVGVAAGSGTGTTVSSTESVAPRGEVDAGESNDDDSEGSGSSRGSEITRRLHPKEPPIWAVKLPPHEVRHEHMDIILPCIAICCLCIIQRPPRRLGILQGLHEGWCRPGYRTSRISQGLSDLTIWTLRRSGKHEKKEMEIWNVSLFCIFCHFFCTCVFNCPRPCRLDTKSVYSWII